MAERFKYNDVKDIIKNFGYELISKEYINANKDLVIKDLEGYYYYTTYSRLNKSTQPLRYYKSNPYSIANIKLWLSKNRSSMTLLSNEYKGSYQKLIFKDINGYYYAGTINHLMVNNKFRIFDKSNPYTIQNIRLWLKLNNKPFELISDIYEDNSKNLKWRCLKEDCKEIFEVSWTNISQVKICPYCAKLSNCLATTNPELASEWHPTKNGNLTPYDITIGSDTSVWWQCKNNPEHEWQTTIYNRNKHHSGCPYCAGQKATKDYNLLVCEPEISKDWDYIKNKNKPEDYTPYSGIKVWWKCHKCGYEWEAYISGYTTRKFCLGCNSVARIMPELLEEWDFLKNIITPYEITCGSAKKIWWICKKCDNKWQTNLNSRAKKNGSGCPKCAESKGEKQLDYILTQHNIPHDTQYTFDNLIGIGGGLLRFDVPVFWNEEKTQLRCLIEYDGLFHYEKQYDDDGYETLQIHDELKDKYCENNNIRLLRIPYWEFDNIENILCKELELVN